MRIFAVSDLHGAVGALESFIAKVREENVDIVTFSGDIVAEGARVREWMAAAQERRLPRCDLAEFHDEERDDLRVYTAFFKALAETGKPCFVVPGNLDAPLDFFLHVALNRKVVAHNTCIIHHRVSDKFSVPLSRDMHICGFGGEITEKNSEQFFGLIFPRVQALYAVEPFIDFPLPKTLILHTVPRLMHTRGSDVVEELIDTVRPSHVFCGAFDDLQGEKTVGTALVVCPGEMKKGHYAVVDSISNKVVFGKLEVGGPRTPSPPPDVVGAGKN